ncbi:MAG: hypothetical protein NVSMB28_25030 [Collimonas sp.]
MSKLIVAAGIMATATLMMLTAPAMAGVDVGVNIGLPGVYVQPRPVYVQPEAVYVQTRPVYIQPEYEQDWHERHMRARQWQEERGHDRREHDDQGRRGHDRGEHHGHDD